MKSILLASLSMLAIIGSANAASQWTDEETAAGLKKVEYVRYALSGQKLSLGSLIALDVDCSVAESYQASIIKEAEHGVVDIVPQTVSVFYAKDNPRSKCNDQRFEGHMLIYTAKKDYTGPDGFTILEVFPSGFARETTFLLNVRAFKPTRAADSVPRVKR
jgi:hypothetical protein